MKKSPKQILQDMTDWRKLYIYSETERQLWKAKCKAQEKYIKAIATHLKELIRIKRMT